jgi:hypothetical protein
MATPSGRLQIDPAEVANLTVQPDGTADGSFKVSMTANTRSSRRSRREKVAAAELLMIDVIEDRSPTVTSTPATRRRIRLKKCSAGARPGRRCGTDQWRQRRAREDRDAGAKPG